MKPEADVATGVSKAFTFGKLRQGYGGRKYRVRIYCLDQQTKNHRHVAMAKVDGRLVRAAEMRTEDEALAAFIKLIDPSVEIVRHGDRRRSVN